MEIYVIRCHHSAETSCLLGLTDTRFLYSIRSHIIVTLMPCLWSQMCWQQPISLCWLPVHHVYALTVMVITEKSFCHAGFSESSSSVLQCTNSRIPAGAQGNARWKFNVLCTGCRDIHAGCTHRQVCAPCQGLQQYTTAQSNRNQMIWNQD